MENSSRISLDYAIRRNKETSFEELPFVICVIANLSGSRNESFKAARPSRFVRVSLATLNDVLNGISPTLRLAFTEAANVGEPCEEVSIDFHSLEDFEPQQVASFLNQYCPAGDFINRSGSLLTDRTDDLQNRIDRIVHHPSFKSLHSTWLGIEMLVKAATMPSLQIFLFDIRKEDLLSKRSSDPQLDDSLLRELEEMTQTAGGHSPSAILADFQFGHRDITVLSVLGRLMASVPTSMIGGASPDFLPRDKYSNVNMVDDTETAHKYMELFAEWRQFRRKEFAKHVFLVLPPVLLRLRYSNIAIPSPGDPAATQTYNESPGDYLWGNSVYAVGTLLIRSFSRYGWVAALTPLDSIGMTLKFPFQPPDANSKAPIGPTAASVFSRSCTSLSALGFLTISECKGSGVVAMFEDRSCSLARDGSAHLIYLLACARLRRALSLYVHNITLPVLDNSSAIKKLRSWLSKYTQPERQEDDKMRYPIESSDVSVSSDDMLRSFAITARLNIDGQRGVYVEFEITTRLASGLNSELPAVKMSFRLGSEELTVRPSGAR